jgi:hypothetical protein
VIEAFAEPVLSERRVRNSRLSVTTFEILQSGQGLGVPSFYSISLNVTRSTSARLSGATDDIVAVRGGCGDVRSFQALRFREVAELCSIERMRGMMFVVLR